MKTSFKQLEAEFRRNLNEYKSTYQDYLVELNNAKGDYWNTEENVTVKNRLAGNQIPFLTEPDISKKQCLHACSSDPECNYVLFSDSGNGECAANQCLKWTKEAGGIIKAQSKPEFFNIFVGNSNSPTKTITLPAPNIKVYPTAINDQDPSWTDRFSVEVSGSQLKVTRIDKKSGWGQQLQLQGVKDVSGFNEYMIHVGSSSTNPKVVTLPTTGLSVSNSPINYQNPEWSDRFSTEVNGDQLTVTRTDDNSGWEQNLQLRAIAGDMSGFMMENKGCASGQGPKTTNYVYSGWSKPTWTDSNNRSFMGNPNTVNPASWKNLGTAHNLLACKDMSLSSSQGPFSSIVFVSEQNKCYGGVPGATQETTEVQGVYSSVPPMGSTNAGGTSTLVYLEKLKNLNNTLKDNLFQMREVVNKQTAKDKQEAKTLANTKKNIHTDYQKLTKDRVKIDEMTKELQSLDAKLGIMERVTTREKMLYMGSAIMAILLFAFILRKSS